MLNSQDLDNYITGHYGEDQFDDVLEDDIHEDDVNDDEYFEREAEDELDAIEEYYDDAPDYYGFPEHWDI
jgi:hypothetical protein